MRSVKVVLPESMWAEMPMLRCLLRVFINRVNVTDEFIQNRPTPLPAKGNTIFLKRGRGIDGRQECLLHQQVPVIPVKVEQTFLSAGGRIYLYSTKRIVNYQLSPQTRRAPKADTPRLSLVRIANGPRVAVSLLRAVGEKRFSDAASRIEKKVAAVNGFREQTITITQLTVGRGDRGWGTQAGQ